MAGQEQDPDGAGGPTGTGDGPDSGLSGDETVRVRNDLSGTVHGLAVQAGTIGTFNYHAPPPPPLGDVPWPLRIGSVPDLVTAHQPRTMLREQIHRAQSTTGTVVLSQVLSGGGGVGKTQLAAALAHHATRTGTDLVLWADAARPAQLLGTYASAARLVRAPGAAGQDVEGDARAFLNWAATTSRSWLMILDNVAEPAALHGWWPPAGTCGEEKATDGPDGAGMRHRAVITTRLKGADISGGGRRVLDVSTYTAAESAAFLRERLAVSEAEHLLDDAVDDVGDVLGHLPLALGYAAAWMINEDQPCAKYVEHFRDQEQRLDQVLPAKWSGEAYGREVAVALLLSLEAAQAAEPVGLAVPALDLAAFLDPAGHPVELWQTDAVADYLTYARVEGVSGGAVQEHDREAGVTAPAVSEGAAVAAPADSGDVRSGALTVSAVTARKAMRLLHRYGLVATRRDDPQRAVRIHALTARAAREVLPAERRRDVVRAVADALLELWPEEDHDDLARAVVLRANTDHLWPFAGDHLWQPDGHPLLFHAGTSHWRNGLPSAAVAYWEHQLAAAERLLDADHPDVLTARGSLAATYGADGRTGEAIALEEQVLADSERLLGTEHPDTLTSRANLAASYWAAGRTGEAVALQERVLADRERLFGTGHPSTLRARSSLAVSYLADGRTGDAVALQEQVLAGREHLLGPQHPDTLHTRISLAATYRAAGRTTEAIALEEQVLTDSERLLGSEHPDTLTSRANLAASYWAAGRTREAITLEEQVLAASERVLGTEHPHTLTYRANLATSYQASGRQEEAIRLLELTVESSRRVLGEEHPATMERAEGLRRWREQGPPQP
ncbi:tetratricopeptide repeat protein [Streptomyces sp. NPDC050504]|uniref:tetratricopeptide repeat protein n=1 Tax=Streptomyces sp. NPDC050504 TaxID=3365618 RepID=UPI0037A317FD